MYLQYYFLLLYYHIMFVTIYVYVYMYMFMWICIVMHVVQGPPGAWKAAFGWSGIPCWNKSE